MAMQCVCTENPGSNSLLLGSGKSRNPAGCQYYFFLKEGETYFYIANNNAEARKHTEEEKENSSF